MSEVRIEYKPLSSLLSAARNPKKHDLNRIMASIKRFGFVTPIVENASTGHVVAGHGRIAALLAMLEAGEPAPGRIREDGPGWSVPVLVGVEFTSEAEAEAYLLADNRLVEAGGWDLEELGALAREHDLIPLGWDEQDLEPLLRADWSPEVPRADGLDLEKGKPIKLTAEQWAIFEKASERVKEGTDAKSDAELLTEICRQYLEMSEGL